MIRLSANLSKKVPLPGVEFSSQQFGAALEIEVRDGDKPEAIRDAFRAIVQASASKLRQTGAVVIPPYNAKPRASGFGRATGQRPLH